MYSVSFTTKIILKHTHVFSFLHHKNHSKTHMYSVSFTTRITVSWSQPWCPRHSFHRHYDPRTEQQTFSQMADRAPLEPALSNTLLFSIRTNHLWIVIFQHPQLSSIQFTHAWRVPYLCTGHSMVLVMVTKRKHNYSWDHCLNCRWMCLVSYWIPTQLKS